MPTAIISKPGRQFVCDDLFPNTGTVGRIALLSANLSLNLGFTANASTDVLSTASAHLMVTGSRFRVVSSGGTVPGGLTAGVDYFAIVTGGSTVKAAATLADALAATAINLTDTGSGTLTLNEQALTVEDTIEVLVNKEVTHPVWTSRAALASLGASTLVGENAEKAPHTVSINNTDASTLAFKYILYLMGSSASATIGDTTCDYFYLSTEASTQSIVTGETKALVSTAQIQPIV